MPIWKMIKTSELPQMATLANLRSPTTGSKPSSTKRSSRPRLISRGLSIRAPSRIQEGKTTAGRRTLERMRALPGSCLKRNGMAWFRALSRNANCDVCAGCPRLDSKSQEKLVKRLTSRNRATEDKMKQIKGFKERFHILLYIKGL